MSINHIGENGGSVYNGVWTTSASDCPWCPAMLRIESGVRSAEASPGTVGSISVSLDNSRSGVVP